MTSTDVSTTIFSQSPTELFQLSDIDFLKAIAWKQATPAKVLAAIDDGNVSNFVSEWSNLHRQQMKSKKKLVGTRPVIPALWSRFAFEQSERSQALIEILEEINAFIPRKSRQKISSLQKKTGKKQNGRKAKKRSHQTQQFSAKISECLDDISTTSEITPYELLVFFELLTNSQLELSSDVFWKLWRTTLTATVELTGSLTEPIGSEIAKDRRLLISGEIPWQAGLLFSAIKGSGKLRKRGQKAIRNSLLDHTDTDGTPQAELLERIPLWLAPLVRSVNASQNYGEKLWNRETSDRFESLVQGIAPLCRPDGKISLSNGSSHRLLSLLQAATQAAGFSKRAPHRNLLQSVTNEVSKSKKSTNRISFSKSDVPAGQSDWARLACLRSDWTPNANSLVVAHHQEKPLIELNARGKNLLEGAWDIEVTREGKPVSFEGDWSCVCWFSDQDADYLELQMRLNDGLQIDRQLLLSRKDDFALLADAVCSAGSAPFEYTSRLPLNKEIEVESLVESRENRLFGSKLNARAFPLALPENRVMSTAGGFGLFSDELVLKQVSSGDGLYAPVLIDWSPRRKQALAEWRNLTVTEIGRIVGMGEAAGHRFQIGNRQILIYRSLSPTDENRSVLGHHTKYETVIGEFDTSGEVSPLVVVE